MRAITIQYRTLIISNRRTLLRTSGLCLLCLVAMGVPRVSLPQTTEQRKHPRFAEVVRHHEASQAASARGEFQIALAEAKKALAAGVVVFGPEAHPTAQLSGYLGLAHLAVGDTTAALLCHQEALAILLRIRPNDHIDLASPYHNLGLTYHRRKELRLARVFYQKSLRILLRSSGSSDPRIATAYRHLGLLEQDAVNTAAAIRYFTNALRSDLKGSRNEDVAADLDLLCRAYREIGDYARAIDAAQKSLTIEQSRKPTDPRRISAAFNELGTLYDAAGDPQRALEFLQRALTLDLQRADNSSTAITLDNMAVAYSHAGKYGMAIEHAKQGLALRVRLFGATHLDVAHSIHNLASVLGRAGKHEEAVLRFREALAILRSHAAERQRLSEEEHNGKLVTTLSNLALSLARVGRADEGLECLREAETLLSMRAGTGHHDLALLQNNLAVVFMARGDRRAALTAAKKASLAFRASGEREARLASLANLAHIRSSMEDLTAAAKTWEEGISLILRYRQELGREKTSFTARYAYFFDRLLALELGRGNHAAAFRTLMRRRGLSIAEGFSQESALIRAGVPQPKSEELLKYDREIARLVAVRTAALNRGAREPAEKALAELQSLESKRDRLDNELVAKYPVYRELRNPQPLSVGEIQKTLRAGETLVSYHLAEAPVAFVVGKKIGLRLVKLAAATGPKSKDAAKTASGKGGAEDLVRESLDARIRNLRTIIMTPDLCPCVVVARSNGDSILWNWADGKSAFETEQKFERDPPPVGTPVFARDLSASAETRGVSVREIGPRSVRSEYGRVSAVIDSGGELARVRERLLVDLHAALLAPVLAAAPETKRLVIVPDGPAYYLPFGMLRDAKGRMLARTIEHKLVHSTIVWHSLRRRGTSRAKRPLFAMGHAVYSGGHAGGTRGVRGVRRGPDASNRAAIDRLRLGRVAADALGHIRWNNLNGTDEEVRRITALAYGSEENAATHRGVPTNLDHLRELDSRGELAAFRILHFAVHGLFVDGQPELNALVLTLPEEARTHRKDAYEAWKAKHGELRGDGYARLGDIKALRLDADLVVMSACETSLGLTAAGEGMLGLPQAFLIAGSRNVVASLWAVDDEATNLLMQAFYKNMLKERMNPERALRAAQDELRGKPAFALPHYWAGFVVYGE